MRWWYCAGSDQLANDAVVPGQLPNVAQRSAVHSQGTMVLPGLQFR